MPITERGGRQAGSVWDRWFVVFEEAPHQDKRVEITAAVRVGHESGSDVILTGIGISREHARFEPAAGCVLLTDLGSTNGTFVNGVRITKPVTLREGDTVIIGDTACTVRQ